MVTMRWVSGTIVVAALVCPAVALAVEELNPFASDGPRVPPANGYVLLSDGSRLEGYIHLTADLPLRIYSRAKKVHVDVAFDEVAEIDVEVEKDTLDREWRWKDAGSTEKVYTDRYYHTHKYVCTLKLKDGADLYGDMNAVLYFQNAAGEKKLFIHKFLTGAQGPENKVPPIVFVQKVVLAEPEGTPE